MFRISRDLFYSYINKGVYSIKFGFGDVKKVLLSFIRDVAECILYIKNHKRYDNQVLKDKNILFVSTYNNYQTLKFLKNKIPDTLLVSPGGYSGNLSDCLNIRSQLNNCMRFDKYFFILYLLMHPRYNIYSLDLILKFYGIEDIYYKILKNNKPNSIIISNDHHPSSRGAILAANKLKLPCIYIQHASVSQYFPPLRNSHALLYGEYSKKIYQQIALTNTKIILVGMHQFDDKMEMIKNKKCTYNIGIAYNGLDDINNVFDLYDQLVSSFPDYIFVLRPHPADKRKLLKECTISRASIETATEFLSQIDVLITNNSSIILEAAVMNVWPLQFDFGINKDDHYDYYGFINSGLSLEMKSFDDVPLAIKNIYKKRIFDVRKRAKIYNASIDSPYEFRVEDKIVEIIKKEILV